MVNKKGYIQRQRQCPEHSSWQESSCRSAQVSPFLCLIQLFENYVSLLSFSCLWMDQMQLDTSLEISPSSFDQTGFWRLLETWLLFDAKTLWLSNTNADSTILVALSLGWTQKSKSSGLVCVLLTRGGIFRCPHLRALVLMNQSTGPTTSEAISSTRSGLPAIVIRTRSPSDILTQSLSDGESFRWIEIARGLRHGREKDTDETTQYASWKIDLMCVKSENLH